MSRTIVPGFVVRYGGALEVCDVGEYAETGRVVAIDYETGRVTVELDQDSRPPPVGAPVVLRFAEAIDEDESLPCPYSS